MLVSGRMPLALTVVCLALSVLASSAVAAGPATVTVRVEGATGTVLAPTQVTTTTAPVVKEGHSCSGTSAAGALQLATSGNWSGHWFEPGGFFVESIEGDSYAGSPSAYWSFWLDNKPASKGICESELEAGASILFFPECFGECPTPPNPLGIEAPATAEVGKPVTVTVTSYANSTGAPSPASNAVVAYEQTSAPTDANGHAPLTFSHAGQVVVNVTAPKSIRTETTVCVHNGSDGTCGTQAASSPAGSAGSVTARGGSVTAAPFKGPYALVPQLTGLVNGHTYRHGHAPRVLAGSVLAHTTVSSIALTLRREYRRRCYAFDGVSTRFVRARCGTGKQFKVSDNGLFSYLLPFALPPGRYVLDIQATDAAGNRTTLARGTSRIVFYVR
jgi:hypothetical protein